MNRHSNTAEIMEGFSCYEHLQGAFRCGIRLSSDESANGIGRCRSVHDFLTRTSRSKTLVVGEVNANLEIQIHRGTWSRVSWSIFRSFSGKRRVDGKTFKAQVYYFLSNDIAA